jgi:hypothetical protein
MADAGKTPWTSVLGAVMSEQAVMTIEAMMAVAMRSLRRIIGASPELREGVQRSGVEVEQPAMSKDQGIRSYICLHLI